ncbi:MAG: protein kinase [Planctomycetaceae bacterium]|nr:protein kinase [Planctomycetaceae bacterium]
MNEPNENREQEIFLACLGESDPAARAALLKCECGEDSQLRTAVEGLLVASQGADSFLEEPFTGLRNVVGREWMEKESSLVGTTIGSYKLREQIGEGGMGVVYVAEQKQPVIRKVALKIIKPGMDSKEVVARFNAERQTLALMNHPNVAKVHDAGTTETGRPYFVMELVNGISITDYCNRNRLTTDERLELFSTVCRAVQHAHLKGIIHRDIKPSNILITQIDGQPVPKVIDFGVAKAMNQRLTEQSIYTQFSQVVGTPLYMSPEQAEYSGVDIDTRTDVYSLGVLLYELLTGSTPFDKKTLNRVGLDEMRRIIREDEPPRPSYRVSTLQAKSLSTASQQRRCEPKQLSQSLRGELDWIVMKALDKDRNRRYESASAFAEEIQRYLNDEPVQACPPSVGYQFRKFVKRHRVLLTTSGAILLTLLFATGISLQYAGQANQEKENAEHNFSAALDAVDQLLKHASSPELAEIPNAQPIRKKILEDTLKFYGQFKTTVGDSVEIRYRAAMTHKTLATLYRKLNDTELAKQACYEALIQAQALAGEFPGVFEHEELLLMSQFELGNFHRHLLQDPQTGQKHFLEALKIADRNLEQVTPQAGHWKLLKSRALRGLADCSQLAGDTDARQTYALECLSLIESLPQDVAESSDVIYALLSAARSYQIGTPLVAEEYYRKALTESKAILSRDSHWEDFQAQLSLSAYASSFFSSRDPEFAAKIVREYIELSERLATEFPSIPFFQSKVNLAYAQLVKLISSGNLSPETTESLTNEMLRRPPNSEAWHRIKATQLAKTDNALVDLTSAIATFPKQLAYYVERGLLLTEQGQIAAALEDWQQAADDGVNIRPHFSRIRKTATSSQISDQDSLALLQFLQSHGDDSYDTQKNLMEVALRLQRYSEALVHINRLIEKGPKSHLYKRRALVHFHLQKKMEALEDLHNAVTLDPRDGSIFTWIPPKLVAASNDAEFQDGILALAGDAVKTHESAYLRACHGSLLAAMGRTQDALVDFNKAGELDPEGTEWRFWAVLALAECGQWKRLIKELQQLIQLKPDAEDCCHRQYQLALAAIASSDREKYQETCRQMLESYSTSEAASETHFTAWTCALATDAVDNYEPAIKLAQHAVDQEKLNQQYLVGLGAILMRAGQYEGAKDKLNQALEIGVDANTSTGYIHYFLGMIEHHFGNAQAAQEHLRVANTSSEKELVDEKSWNRKLTLELLRTEVEQLIGSPRSWLPQSPELLMLIAR